VSERQKSVVKRKFNKERVKTNDSERGREGGEKEKRERERGQSTRERETREREREREREDSQQEIMHLSIFRHTNVF
jgi:hypothetical protein